jgi:hypothetical protein
MRSTHRLSWLWRVVGKLRNDHYREERESGIQTFGRQATAVAAARADRRKSGKPLDGAGEQPESGRQPGATVLGLKAQRTEIGIDRFIADCRRAAQQWGPRRIAEIYVFHSDRSFFALQVFLCNPASGRDIFSCGDMACSFESFPGGVGATAIGPPPSNRSSC